MADIFISYKREDESLAKQLSEQLTRKGWSVWWDHHLHGGVDYDKKIEEELKTCKCVIVLWSKTSIESRNVKDEANEALKQNKLIPIMVGDVQPPLGFRMIQCIKWNANAKVEAFEIEPVIQSISLLIEKKGTGIPPSIPDDKNKGVRTLTTGLIITVIVLVIAVIIYRYNKSVTEDKSDLNIGHTDSEVIDTAQTRIVKADTLNVPVVDSANNSIIDSAANVQYVDTSASTEYVGELDLHTRLGNHFHYKGNIKNGSANGFGKATFDDGAVYEGNFENNRRMGRFSITEDSVKYLTVFQNDSAIEVLGLPIAFGTYKGTYDGGVEGNYVVPNGNGRFTFQDGYFSGTFDNGEVKVGKVNMTYPFISIGSGNDKAISTTYEGDVIGFTAHGFGILRFSDGGYYEGSFERGYLNGVGTLVRNGQTTRGSWEHGVYKGK